MLIRLIHLQKYNGQSIIKLTFLTFTIIDRNFPDFNFGEVAESNMDHNRGQITSGHYGRIGQNGQNRRYWLARYDHKYGPYWV